MDRAERERYSRQILFAGIGESGQEALLRSHAVDRGLRRAGQFSCGGAGARRRRTLTIIDRDYVEPSNLHRQWLFDEADAAEALPKAAAAERRLAAHQFRRDVARHRGRSDRRAMSRNCSAAPT